MEYKFGPWLPDVTDLKNPGLEVCTNVIPGPGGYQPAYGSSPMTADAGAPVLSAKMFERADGTRVTVCATAGDLHVIIAGTVTNSGLALALTQYVNFVRFGDSVYATVKDGGTWRLADLDTDTTFAAAAWTIPSGKTMARINEFLFMGNLTDTDASNAPYRIRWSPFNNPGGEWETDIGTQSDAIDMPTDFGPVIGIAGYTYGVILQRYGISRISYTGATAPFAKEVVDQQRGCASTASIVAVGDRTYFLSDDGFFFTDGGPSQVISRGRIWQWFLANAGQFYLDKVIGAVDWPNRCVIWTVPDASGIIQGLLYFNWETEWWSYVAFPVDVVLTSGRDGLSLEDVSALYPSLDAMTLSLDDAAFLARGRSLAVFVNGELRQLAGDTLECLLTTGEFQMAPRRKQFVRDVTPLVTNAEENIIVSLAGRDRQTDTFTSTGDVAMGPLGFCPMNFDSRYFRVTVKVPATALWRDAYGFQIDAEASGI
jgi:hypothetical protein